MLQMKRLLSGPPIKRIPSIKRTQSWVPELTIGPFITNPYSADTSIKADEDTKIYGIWLISIVKNLY